MAGGKTLYRGRLVLLSASERVVGLSAGTSSIAGASASSSSKSNRKADKRFGRFKKSVVGFSPEETALYGTVVIPWALDLRSRSQSRDWISSIMERHAAKSFWIVCIMSIVVVEGLRDVVATSTDDGGMF